MPKPKKGARLGGSASHQKKILANLAAQLFINEKITTTDAKAKLLRPYAEKLITKAKSGTVADRREVAKHIQDRDIIFRLFNELAPQFEGREGGYTRIVKLGVRRGDSAPISQVQLVLEPVNSSRDSRVAASQEAETEVAEEQVEVPAEVATEETTESVDEVNADEVSAEEK